LDRRSEPERAALDRDRSIERDFRELDADGDGTISHEEFRAFSLRAGKGDD